MNSKHTRKLHTVYTAHWKCAALGFARDPTLCSCIACVEADQLKSTVSANSVWIARAVIECKRTRCAAARRSCSNFGYDSLRPSETEVARRWGAAPHDAAVELQDISEHNTADEDAPPPAAGRAVSALDALDALHWMRRRLRLPDEHATVSALDALKRRRDAPVSPRRSSTETLYVGGVSSLEPH